jgi:hypothetical protein
MSTWLSAIGIFSSLIGSWLVAYEVVNKFRGVSHSVSVGWGGSGTASKTEPFLQWESKRNFVMWWGLAFITGGSFLQLASLFAL